MGNSMQHPDNNHATHQQHTTVNSTGLESKEKSQNKSGDHPSVNNTANPMNIARTTQNHVAAITPANKEQLEEFVMVGTFFTDDSIGLSPPSSPEPKSRDDAGQEEQEQQLHSGGNSEETLSSRLKSDEPHTSHRNESLRFNPRDDEEEMIDFDSAHQSPFCDDSKEAFSDEPEPAEQPVDNILQSRDSSIQRYQDGEIMEEVERTTDVPEPCAMEGDEAIDPPKATSTTKNGNTYAIGDHVYQWCSLAGIPGVFQHHGIVIGVQPAGDETYLTIVDFSNVLPNTSSRSDIPQGVDENAIVDPEKNSPPAATIKDDECSTKCDEEAVEECCADSSVTSAEAEEGESAEKTQDLEKENVKAEGDETPHQSRQKRQRSPFFFSTPSSGRPNPMYSSSSNLSPTLSTSAQPPRRQRQPFFMSSTSSSSAETMLSSSFPDSVRTYTISSHKWHKVVYQANMWQRHFWRSGTCTSVASDPPGLVMARVFFLMEHRHLVPKYHVLQSNCECMAVWCKTGQWSTLQAMSLLSVAAASQVKQATTLAAIAASQQVTVPASGFMGMLGYTTQVSLVSTQPYLLPAIGIYGALTVAVPMLLLNQAQKAWKRTTDVLTQEFWNFAVKEPETFAECITYWSSRSSSEDDDSGRGAVELAVS